MRWTTRSEEHTSELQSRFGISYAVFCLKKKSRGRHGAPLLDALRGRVLAQDRGAGARLTRAMARARRRPTCTGRVQQGFLFFFSPPRAPPSFPPSPTPPPSE